MGRCGCGQNGGDNCPCLLVGIDTGSIQESVTGAGSGMSPYGISGKVITYFDVDDYGAVPDGVTDSTTAIQAAINAAFSAGGGNVKLHSGTYLSGQLRLKTKVHLQGAGAGTRLHLRNGENKPFLVLDAPTTTELVTISDLFIFGNNANQVGTTNHGIELNNTGFVSGSFGNIYPLHRVKNVTMWQVRGIGLYLHGARSGEYRIEDVHVLESFQGFKILVPDCFFTDCSSGASSREGFFISAESGSAYYENCKSWYSGRNVIDNDTTNAHGFYCNAVNINMSNCVAQDNAADGFRFHNARNLVLMGIYGDTNGFSVPGSGIVLDGVTNTVLVGYSDDRSVFQGFGPTTQQYGLKLSGGSTGNSIMMTVGTSLLGDTNGPLTFNTVLFSGQNSLSTFQQFGSVRVVNSGVDTFQITGFPGRLQLTSNDGVGVIGSSILQTIAGGGGGRFLQLDPTPVPAATGQVQIQLFSNVNTSGDKELVIFKGDGSATATFSVVAVDGSVFAGNINGKILTLTDPTGVRVATFKELLGGGGQSILQVDAIPNPAATGDSLIQFFGGTNTVGGKEFDIMKGDGSGNFCLAVVPPSGDLYHADGARITYGSTVGTKLGTSATQKLAFHDLPPRVLETVTGSRGGNAALADLLTKLHDKGVIIDGTSP